MCLLYKILIDDEKAKKTDYISKKDCLLIFLYILHKLFTYDFRKFMEEKWLPWLVTKYGN